MRKLITALCISLLLLASGAAYAADALYRMLHADEVESFKKDQDAFIVGKLIEQQEDRFTVEVIKVISGKVNSRKISVSSDFYYGGGQTLPKLNDFCVMSLKQSGHIYNKAWGVFKADSGNYATLRLLPENSKTQGLNADLEAIEWYTNSGGTEKDFSFNSERAYVKRPSGEVVQLYPKVTSREKSEKIKLTEEKTATTNFCMSTKNIISFLLFVTFIISFVSKALIQKKKSGTRAFVMGKGMQKSRESRIVEVLIRVCSFVWGTAWAVHALFDPWIRQKMGVLFSVQQLDKIGLFTMAIGLLVFIKAMVDMRNSWRVGIDKETKTQLIVNGLYKYSRNPAFVGFDLMVAGLFLTYSNILVLIVFVVNVLCFHLQILQEEKHLIASFGDEYTNYMKLTPRYW